MSEEEPKPEDTPKESPEQEEEKSADDSADSQESDSVEKTIEDLNEASNRLEESYKRFEAAKVRTNQLKTDAILAGTATAGSGRVPETPNEYAKRVMAGDVSGKK